MTGIDLPAPDGITMSVVAAYWRRVHFPEHGYQRAGHHVYGELIARAVLAERPDTYPVFRGPAGWLRGHVDGGTWSVVAELDPAQYDTYWRTGHCPDANGRPP